MSHTVSGQTTTYTWDVAADLPVVLQDGTNTYVYGLDLISATDGSSAQTYYLYDGLGSTTEMTNGSGTVLAAYSYDVFGAIRSQTGSSPNYWLFTGEQRDTDSALYYLRARYYDPGIGRFLGRDPAGAGHPYAYVENNPVNFVDPYGLDLCSAASGIFGKKKNCGQAVNAVGGVAGDVAGAANEAADTVSSFITDSYFDYNVTAMCFAGITYGVQLSWNEGIHPYIGGGGSNYCGLSASLTAGPHQSISNGLGCGGQYGANPLSWPSGGAVQFGAGPTVQTGAGGIHLKEGALKATGFWEVGVAASAGLSVPILSIPGTFSGTCYYAFPNLSPF